MLVQIKTSSCDIFGGITDCSVPRIYCPFCKRKFTFTETREVTPKELYELINDFDFVTTVIIVLKY